MAVVVNENPVPDEASLIRKQINCGKFGLLCALVYKLTRNLISTKVIFEGNLWGPVSALSADAQDQTAIRTQFSTQDKDQHRLRELLCRCLWRGCPPDVAKHPHQIAGCEVIALALSCDGSLPIYQFPPGDSLQKTTYDNLDTV
jgi:hypothetical protein